MPLRSVVPERPRSARPADITAMQSQMLKSNMDLKREGRQPGARRSTRIFGCRSKTASMTIDSGFNSFIDREPICFNCLGCYSSQR